MINGISAANPVQQTYAVKGTESAPKTAEKSLKNIDEYVPSEEKEHAGLYAAVPDDDGNMSVKFDAPDAPENKKETTTANTDAVDAEIKQLKERMTELQRKLRTADESSAAEISRQLEQVSQELAMKDNDQYRRENAVFT